MKPGCPASGCAPCRLPAGSATPQQKSCSLCRNPHGHHHRLQHPRRRRGNGAGTAWPSNRRECRIAGGLRRFAPDSIVDIDVAAVIQSTRQGVGKQIADMVRQLINGDDIDTLQVLWQPEFSRPDGVNNAKFQTRSQIRNVLVCIRNVSDQHSGHPDDWRCLMQDSVFRLVSNTVDVVIKRTRLPKFSTGAAPSALFAAGCRYARTPGG